MFLRLQPPHVHFHDARDLRCADDHLLRDVADTIGRILEPRGLAVWMGGVHMCMVMRGVEQESSFMETNVLRGEFLNDERTRQEFMSIVNRRGQRE
jgi:GTP cyclohydrolase I